MSNKAPLEKTPVRRRPERASRFFYDGTRKKKVKTFKVDLIDRFIGERQLNLKSIKGRKKKEGEKSKVLSSFIGVKNIDQAEARAITVRGLGKPRGSGQSGIRTIRSTSDASVGLGVEMPESDGRSDESNRL